jgi:inositol polyphosphate 5-phosphatase INPP5B/F
MVCGGCPEGVFLAVVFLGSLPTQRKVFAHSPFSFSPSHFLLALVASPVPCIALGASLDLSSEAE